MHWDSCIAAELFRRDSTHASSEKKYVMRKSKKRAKKLSLTKEDMLVLNHEMAGVVGGASPAKPAPFTQQKSNNVWCPLDVPPTNPNSNITFCVTR